MCQPRSLTLDPREVQIVHVWARCVRRGFLCGYDPVSGQDFEHRRDWIRQRAEVLASIYAVDVVTFAILTNHMHFVLRSRSDVVARWTDEEVALRSMKLQGRQWFRADGSFRKSTAAELKRRSGDAALIARMRLRLSDISKWMQALDQHISVKANREDDVRGAFWEQRFGSEVLTETADLLACMIYVDLNPIRARMATTPEDSDFTGGYERSADLRIKLAVDGDKTVLQLVEAEEDGGSSNCQNLGGPGDDDAQEWDVHHWERLGAEHSGWLSPIEIDEASDPVGADSDPSQRRASRKGVLPMSLMQYLNLLDWSGRTVRADKRGAIPAGLDSIMQRLGLSAERLLDSMEDFALSRESYFAATERGGSPNQPHQPTHALFA